MKNCVKIDFNSIQVLDQIGKGPFSEVYQIKEKKNKIFLAAKIFYDHNKEEEDPKSFTNKILQYSEQNSKLSHPSLNHILGFSPFDFSQNANPVIITNYMRNGSLENLIHSKNHFFPDIKSINTHKLITIYGIASALSYLHSHEIIHGNLKPTNILFDDDLNPKICDFGLSKIFPQNQDSQSIIYTPPEVILNQNYTKLSDVYAFSIISYLILTNEKQFKIFSFEEIKNGIRPDLNSSIPEQFKELLERCWSQEPKERPSFEEIVNELRTNPEFITDSIDKKKFHNYIDYLDEYQRMIETKKKPFSFNEFIMIKNRKRAKKEQSKKLFDKWKKLLFGDADQTEKSEAIDCLTLLVEEEEIDAIYTYAWLMYKGNDIVESNKKEAANFFKTAADKGHKKSMLAYAIMLDNGDGIVTNTKEAIRYFKMAADLGDLNAMYIYGQKLNKGDGVDVNREEASKYFKKAADKGQAEAMYEFSKCPNCRDESIRYLRMAANKGIIDAIYDYAIKLKNGDGVRLNKKEGARYLKIAADKGHIKSTIEYAFMLKDGDGVDSNVEESLQYFKMAANEGDIDALFNLALILNSEGRSEDEKKEAAKNFKKAADKGHLESMFNYALMNQNGCGIQINEKEAFKYYKIAADRGHPDAIRNYSHMLSNKDKTTNNKDIEQAPTKQTKKHDTDEINHFVSLMAKNDSIPAKKDEMINYIKSEADNGDADGMFSYALKLDQGSGIQVNKKEAALYYKKAADKGHKDAMFTYATKLYTGEGVDVDKIESARYFKQAADRGQKEAMHNYAVMLFKGDGIQTDQKEAARYYKMAADNDDSDPNVIHSYAMILYAGKGVEVDRKDAARYFKRAADKGHLESMFKYASMLKNGDGIEINKKEAAKYFKMAADKGHRDSIMNYAYMLCGGDGVKRNIKEATRYCEIALQKGDPNAMIFLNLLSMYK